jgi:ABC-type dipeptide/oligopeptide/nickel transport system ATPase component
MLSPPTACPFAPRCRYRVDICDQELPGLVRRGPEQQAACFNPVPAEEWKRSRAGGGHNA